MTTNVVYSRLTPTIYVQAMIIYRELILAYNVSSDLHRDVPCARRTCLLVLSTTDLDAYFVQPTNQQRDAVMNVHFSMEMFWLKGSCPEIWCIKEMRPECVKITRTGGFGDAKAVHRGWLIPKFEESRRDVDEKADMFFIITANHL
jgi:hypothetical protein